jgi:hypothetical protein
MIGCERKYLQILKVYNDLMTTLICNVVVGRGIMDIVLKALDLPNK